MATPQVDAENRTIECFYRVREAGLLHPSTQNNPAGPISAAALEALALYGVYPLSSDLTRDHRPYLPPPVTVPTRPPSPQIAKTLPFGQIEFTAPGSPIRSIGSFNFTSSTIPSGGPAPAAKTAKKATTKVAKPTK